MTSLLTDTRPETGTVRETFGPIVDRIAAHPQVPAELAEAVMVETLRFVDLAATTDVAVAPSRLVDVGWHEFILFTRDYMALLGRARRLRAPRPQQPRRHRCADRVPAHPGTVHRAARPAR